MNTMEVTDYKEAYFRLKADIRTYRSPIKEMARYIDKMTMIGRQYSQLEGNIRRNLEEGEESQDLMDTFETEFSVLQQMIDVTIAGLNRNRLLMEAVDEGDRDRKDLIGDF